jgi:hypothetical protein
MVGGELSQGWVLTCKPTTAISADLVKNRLRLLGVGLSDICLMTVTCTHPVIHWKRDVRNGAI